ncbi:potassium ABC transporter ATPase [Massilia forsythiae]|nr:potassium ABC transporter ATPase [Massilia forsythiae]
MDIVYIGAIAALFALVWGMAAGCARLGDKE